MLRLGKVHLQTCKQKRINQGPAKMGWKVTLCQIARVWGFAGLIEAWSHTLLCFSLQLFQKGESHPSSQAKGKLRLPSGPTSNLSPSPGTEAGSAFMFQ